MPCEMLALLPSVLGKRPDERGHRIHMLHMPANCITVFHFTMIRVLCQVVSVDSKARFKVIGPPPLLKAPPLPKSEDGIPELVRRNSIPPLPESDKKGGSSTQTLGRDDEAGSQAGTGVTDEDARDTAEEGQKKIEQIDAKLA